MGFSSATFLRSQFRDSTENNIDFNWIFRSFRFAGVQVLNTARIVFPFAFFSLPFKCLSWKWMHFTFNYNLLWFPPPQWWLAKARWNRFLTWGWAGFRCFVTFPFCSTPISRWSLKPITWLRVFTESRYATCRPTLCSMLKYNWNVFLSSYACIFYFNLFFAICSSARLETVGLKQLNHRNCAFVPSAKICYKYIYIFLPRNW